MNPVERRAPAIKPSNSNLLYAVPIVIVMSLVFWGAALLLVYVANDWLSPSADERSIPAVRTY